MYKIRWSKYPSGLCSGYIPGGFPIFASGVSVSLYLSKAINYCNNVTGNYMAKKNLQETPLKYGVRIKNIRDARRLLTRIINLLLKDEIEVDRGRAVVYAASVLLTAFETEKLELVEKRLNELEQGRTNGKISEHTFTPQSN
jgi:hypothetical protein